MRPLCFLPGVRLIGRIPVRGVGRLLNHSYDRVESFPEPAETRTIDGDRFHVDFSHDLEWRLFAWGQYERHVRTVLVSEVRPGDTCIDVGANIGTHLVALARAVGPAGIVVALEADPGVADRLDANIVLNELPNVRVIRAAAAASSGLTLRLNTTPTTSRSHAQASLLALDHLTGSAISVPTIAIDDLGLTAVRLIKIDVEGAEWDVLQGARRTLESDRPTLVFEFNRHYSARSFSEVRDFLVCVGYSSLSEIPEPAGRVWISNQPLADRRRSDPAIENANILAR